MYIFKAGIGIVVRRLLIGQNYFFAGLLSVDKKGQTLF